MDTAPLVGWDGAAAHLNTTERHVRNLAARREIPYVKVGKLVKFRPADLDAYIAAHVIDARQVG